MTFSLKSLELIAVMKAVNDGFLDILKSELISVLGEETDSLKEGVVPRFNPFVRLV